MSHSSIIIGLSVALITAICSTNASSQVKAWYVTGTTKVMRDASYKKAPKWELRGARNEVESCQLVLLSETPVNDVKITVSDIKQMTGNSRLSTELLKVEYVPLGEKQIPYPDPLPPLNSAIDLKANQAQPVWISVRIPKTAEKGIYKGGINVEVNGKRTTYPLIVKVWDFTLPDTPASATSFGMINGFVARTHGIKEDSPEMPKLIAKYYEMLLDHKVSCYYIPVDVLSDEADKYLSDPRMTSFIIPYPEEDEKLIQIADKLRKGGWLNKGCFYPIDEPVNPEAYEKFNAIVERLKRLVPDYRLVTPFFRHPAIAGQDAFTQMSGKVNVWCPTSNFFDTEPRMESFMAERRKAGEATWWYVCWKPEEPYNNFLVDMSCMSHRVLFWQQKRLGMQGLLYWSTTWWNPGSGCEDPWTTMATVADLSPTVYGDGSLLYPGKKVGVDGPVSSLRLKMIREGIEDFDYLTLAEKVLGPDVAQDYAKRITRTLTDFERDPKVLDTVRTQLGNTIEHAMKK